MNYGTVFSDSAWQNRIITSNIHGLQPDDFWEVRRASGDPKVVELIPSDAMFENSVLAASMGTTLWFTAEDKAAGMPQALLASGQYHICRSLLSYINRIEKDPTNTTEGHSLLIGCKPQLLEAWKRFQRDPQFMVPKV